MRAPDSSRGGCASAGFRHHGADWLPAEALRILRGRVSQTTGEAFSFAAEAMRLWATKGERARDGWAAAAQIDGPSFADYREALRAGFWRAWR